MVIYSNLHRLYVNFLLTRAALILTLFFLACFSPSQDDWLPRLHTLAKTDEDEQVRLDAWSFLLTLSEQRKTKLFFRFIFLAITH